MHALSSRTVEALHCMLRNSELEWVIGGAMGWVRLQLVVCMVVLLMRLVLALQQYNEG